MKSVFQEKDVQELMTRINNLTAETQPDWGKMSIGQMLAHCNVAYEMTFEDHHPKPNGLTRFMLKLFVKQAVVGPKPYKKNSRTAPAFLITTEKDFETEKARLLGYMDKTLKLGDAHFDGKESHSFGAMTVKEWDTMFYKHLDHHLTQFGV